MAALSVTPADDDSDKSILYFPSGALDRCQGHIERTADVGTLLGQHPVLGGADILDADPGSDGPRQPAAVVRQIGAGIAAGGSQMNRRQRQAIQMHAKQILKIEPQPVDDAARIRTPWAGGPAQFIHQGENLLQPPSDLCGDGFRCRQLLPVAIDQTAQCPVGGCPAGSRLCS